MRAAAAVPIVTAMDIFQPPALIPTAHPGRTATIRGRRFIRGPRKSAVTAGTMIATVQPTKVVRSVMGETMMVMGCAMKISLAVQALRVPAQ